jgi:hypothetical protein
MSPFKTSEEVNLPNGPAAAAILAAGAGCCVLGMLAVLADATQSIAGWLTWYRPTGPLSGVTTLGIFCWLGFWAVLARAWRTKTVALATTNAIAYILLAIGILLTFPPFEDLLLRK